MCFAILRGSCIQACLIVVLCLIQSTQAFAGDTQQIALTAVRWQPNGKVVFAQREGLANGLLEIQEGDAALKGAMFRNGTVEFDIRPLADGMPGIQFRRESADSMEILYLRPSPECPVAVDCVQYVPRVHGVMPWEMYPQYQSAAPVSERGWSHIKLVVSGRRMNVFINRPAKPTLVVGHLEGDARQGGLSLVGPAAFANVTVLPGVTEGLSPQPALDAAAADPGLVRHWKVSQPFSHTLEDVPALSEMPDARGHWTPIVAEDLGLINLSRLYGSPTDRSTGARVWLKTDIVAGSAHVVHVSMAYLHEAAVFVNGAQVFNGRNLYVEGTPIGRRSLANAAFEAKLRKGHNIVAVALANILVPGHNHYGWGMQVRINNPKGLILKPSP